MYRYLTVALVAAVLAAIGTWKVQNWRFEAIEHQRQEAQAEQRRIDGKRVDDAATAHEQDKVRIETKYVQIVKKVPHEVQKLVYRNVCISPDGVRNINDLIDTYDPGKPAATVPEAGRAPQRPRK